jgi:hypothetical protein
MTRPVPATHRDCDREPGDLDRLADLRRVLDQHPPREGICRQNTRALAAMGAAR